MRLDAAGARHVVREAARSVARAQPEKEYWCAVLDCMFETLPENKSVVCFRSLLASAVDIVALRIVSSGYQRYTTPGVTDSLNFR